MKNINLLCFLIVLCLIPSCAQQKNFLFSEASILNVDNNSIEERGHLVLKVSPLVLRLQERKFILKKHALSEKLKKYISEILSESNSLQDELLAVSSAMIVVRQTKQSENIPPHYLYQYDFEQNDWICAWHTPTQPMWIVKDEHPSFFRTVYIIKQRNRVILKDRFWGGISIIYVVQGRHHKAPYAITSMWNPVNFDAFLTTSNYIKNRVNPISYDIAKNNCQTIKGK